MTQTRRPCEYTVQFKQSNGKQMSFLSTGQSAARLLWGGQRAKGGGEGSGVHPHCWLLCRWSVVDVQERGPGRKPSRIFLDVLVMRCCSHPTQWCSPCLPSRKCKWMVERLRASPASWGSTATAGSSWPKMICSRKGTPLMCTQQKCIYQKHINKYIDLFIFFPFLFILTPEGTWQTVQTLEVQGKWLQGEIV